MVSSVRSYVYTDLLSTRESSPSNGGSICTPLTPLDPPLIYDAYMQELVLYVVIFVPSQFWLASVLNTPVLVMQAYCKKPMHD